MDNSECGFGVGQREVNLVERYPFVHTLVNQHQWLSPNKDPGEGKPKLFRFYPLLYQNLPNSVPIRLNNCLKEPIHVSQPLFQYIM